ncbi:DNA polymerase III subunit beta [Rhizobium lusitanum]|uniref:Beta sliding clamp n=1 Tax=Rhizobium lusitanum TaxID=293958 RepID=A0A6L9U4Y5_9HYPH|nr:DNA polymerase III subunit beta [Rhizobium lusitanum]NEI71015.1 DNA polymerase III subunit beta [Rhizobium lusitanum]
MTAHMQRILQSASEIAIEAAISQKISAEVIQFRPRQPQKEVGVETAPTAIEVYATSLIAENDNTPGTEQPIAPVIGSSVVIERALLTRAVEIVNNVIERRNSIPILSNIALRGNGNTLQLIGTDLDIEIVASVPGAADREFGTTLPAHILKDLLKRATASDFVAMTTGETRDALDFERVHYDLQSLSLADWPHMSGPAAGAFEFHLPGRALWEGLDSTMGAISTEETRYYLNGIFLHTIEHADGAKLVMVATDGHRLYRQEFDAPFGSCGMPAVIVPRKTVQLLHKLMKGKSCPDDVAIVVDSSKIRISFGDIITTSKLIDGTFPDYQRVIPIHNNKRATLHAETAMEAIRAVTLISTERGRACKYTFAPGNCRLTVSNPDSGNASADIPCDYDGEPMEIGFNASYMLAIIEDAVGNGSSVSMQLYDAASPAVITGDRKGWTGVCMPMRV